MHRKLLTTLAVGSLFAACIAHASGDNCDAQLAKKAFAKCTACHI